jgi:hypothetical protein
MTRAIAIALVLSSLLTAPALAAGLHVAAAEVAVAPSDDTLFGRGEQAIVAPAWDDPSSGDVLR